MHFFPHLSLVLITALPFTTAQSSNPTLANFSVIEPAFASLLGSSPSISLIYNASEPLFHEAAVYHSSSDSLFVTSNRIKLPSGESNAATSNQTILLTRVTNVSSADPSQIQLVPINASAIALPNGGTNYPASLTSSSEEGVLLCAQGTKTQTSGIFVIPSPISDPNTAIPIVTSFYNREFNSPNDVVVNPLDNSSIWFTDPSYGFLQGVRPPPVLPNQVYRYDPTTNSTRVVADGFDEPNGLAFSKDYAVLYVTDTGASNFADGNGPATIYAYDVQPGPFLGNKRVFAYAPAGLPDGIKVDPHGNVWSGTGDGLTVWNADGLLIGEIRIAGGVANFGFKYDAAHSKIEAIFLMGETKLWRVVL